MFEAKTNAVNCSQHYVLEMCGLMLRLGVVLCYRLMGFLFKRVIVYGFYQRLRLHIFQIRLKALPDSLD